MKTVIITQKGASIKANSWKEGQEISCHPTLAEDFIKRGIAVDPEDESTGSAKQPKTPKQPKTAKQ